MVRVPSLDHAHPHVIHGYGAGVAILGGQRVPDSQIFGPGLSSPLNDCVSAHDSQVRIGWAWALVPEWPCA